MAARAVPWVAPVFYGAVLLAGSAAWNGPGWSLAAFAGALAALTLLDLLERRRYPVRTPLRSATGLLVARVALTTVAIGLDRAQLAQVLVVLIPFQAYFAFGRRVSLWLAGSFLVLAPVAVATTHPGWYRDAEQVGDLLMLALGVVMAVAMAAVAVEAQTGRARLQQAQGELAELTAAAERARLARDLHDTVGHHLTAIAVQLEKSATFRDLDPAAADRALSDARGSAHLALTDVRTAVRALRESSGPISLAGLLEELTARLSSPRLLVRADVAGSQEGYDSATLTALYRVAQEGLTNAVRHARAGRITVRVRLGPEAAVLEVVDDGRGMPWSGSGGDRSDPSPWRAEPAAVAADRTPAAGPPPGAPPRPGSAWRPDALATVPGREPGSAPEDPVPRAGYGLLGIRERVQALGGRLTVRSAPGAGTTLAVTVPRAGEAR